MMADAPQVYNRPDEGLQAYTPSKGPTTHEFAFDKDTSIFGLQRRRFWFLISLAVIVVALAVGGSIGGTMAVRHAECKASTQSQQAAANLQACTTSSPSPTSNADPASATPSSSTGYYVPLSPTAVARVDNSCPVSNGKLLSVLGDTFTCYGNRDAGGNNIAGFIAYTLQNCIDGCSTFNTIEQTNQEKSKCVGVVMGYDFKRDYLTNNGANCWLKSRLDSTNLLASEYGTVALLSG